MRRGRIFFMLAFVLILGLVAVFVVYRFVLAPDQVAAEPGEALPTQQVDLVNVVRIGQSLPKGAVLEAAALEEVPYQRDLLVEGMFTNLNEVAGRRVKYEVEAGTLLTQGMLLGDGEQLSDSGSVWALNIPPGMVAVSIPTNRLASVSYAPQPGDHVNVIATMMMVDLDTDFQTLLPNNTGAVLGSGPGVLIGTGTLEDSVIQINENIEKVTAQNSTGGSAAPQGRAEVDPVLGQTFYIVPSEPTQRPRLVSQSLLQDAIVLRMGEFPADDGPARNKQVDPTGTGEQAGEVEMASAQTQVEEPVQNEPKRPEVVTLIVTPQDAVTLNYLVYTGAKLTLALRSPNDPNRYETEAVTLQFLLDQYNIPVPVKLPYGLEPKAVPIDVEWKPPVLEDQPVATPMP